MDSDEELFAGSFFRKLCSQPFASTLFRSAVPQADNPDDARARDIALFETVVTANSSDRGIHKNFKSRPFLTKVHFMDSQISTVHYLLSALYREI